MKKHKILTMLFWFYDSRDNSDITLLILELYAMHTSRKYFA